MTKLTSGGEDDGYSSIPDKKGTPAKKGTSIRGKPPPEPEKDGSNPIAKLFFGRKNF